MKESKRIVLGMLGSFLLVVMSVVFVGNVYAADQEKKDDNDQKGWFVPRDTKLKNFYVGFGVGPMYSNSPDTNQDGSVTGVQKDHQGWSGKTFVGYQFNDHFAAEVGYINLGGSRFDGVSDGTGPSWSSGPVVAESEVQGENLSAVVRWPITDRLTLIGTAGIFWWESQETFIDGGHKTTEKDSGNGGTFSGGIEYDVGLKDRFVYRAEVQNFVVDDSAYDITAGVFSIVYRFP